MNKEEAEANKADLREADLRWADLSGANLRWADLRWADLSGANLREADLRWADLRWANLRRADLSGANLREAIGNNAELKTIQAGKYQLTYTATTMAIGCEQHSIEDWMGFGDDAIRAMDSGALDWWQVWKPILKIIISTEE